MAYSADKSKISFDLSFPDYSSLGIWKKSAENITSGGIYSTEIISENNDIFTSINDCNYDSGAMTAIYEKQSGKTSSALGSIKNATSQKIIYFNNELYTVYIDSDTYNKLYLKKKTADGWVNVDSFSGGADDFFGNTNIFTNGDTLYVSFVTGNACSVFKLTTGGLVLVSDTLSSGEQSFSNPTFCCYNGKIYALFSVIGFSTYEKHTQLWSCDKLSGEWSLVQLLTAENSNTHILCSDGEKLYALYGGGFGSSSSYLFKYNGVSLSETALDFTSGASTGLSLDVGDGIVAVSYIKDGLGCVYADVGNGFSKVGGTVASAVTDMKIAVTENRVWALMTDNSGTSLRSKAVRNPVVEPILSSKVTVNAENHFIIIPKGTANIDELVSVSNGGSFVSPDVGAFFGTGRRIVLSDADGDANTVFTAVVMGDLDGDGSVDALDAFVSEKAASSFETLLDSRLVAADFNGDGVITADDYAANVNTALS